MQPMAFRPKHGMTNTPEFRAWQGAKTRCNNPRSKDYPRWGGRGIKMSPLWENDFLAFFNAVGPKPSPKHSLDRIQGHLGYEPGNVRWATSKEQAENRRSSVIVEAFGRLQTVTALVESACVARSTLRRRLARGVPPEQAATQPLPALPPNSNPVTHAGKTLSVRAWAKEKQIPARTLAHRLSVGWPVEQALETPPGRASSLEWERRRGLRTS